MQTRLSLCVVLSALTLSGLGHINRNWILFYTILYAVLLIGSGLFDADTLQLKRVRVIPAFADVVFVSLIVYYTGGSNSSWFLIYFFPIISVSRYLGHLGSIVIAAEVIISYAWLYFYDTSSQGIDPVSFAVRCLSFLGIALVAGNLSKSKPLEELSIIKIFTEIDNAMLSETRTDLVFKLILKRGLELTGSEMGHIRLIDDKTQEATVAAAIGQPEDHNWRLGPLDKGFSRRVIESKKSLIIQEITRRDLVRYLGTYFRLYKPRPRSALFVPIVHRDTAIGVRVLTRLLP